MTEHINALPLCCLSRFMYYNAECHYVDCCYAECRSAECRCAKDARGLTAHQCHGSLILQQNLKEFSPCLIDATTFSRMTLGRMTPNVLER
jgi:hypothetical protein